MGRRLLLALVLAFSMTAPASAAPLPLDCTGVTKAAKRKPVLLVPGTTLDPATEFSWNYERDFEQRGFPFCALTSPGNAMADIQVNGQLVARAIRAMHRRTGRKVQIVGHSQGGMVPRWALKYWPETRKLVDDLVGMAASNHGALQADGACLAAGCAPAIWQQQPDSNFMTALNSGPETFKGISYTSVYTRFDEVVQPNLDAETGSTSLRTGKGERTNVAVQDICPASVVDHIGAGTYDPVVHALVIDALTHKGPADPARIDPAVCAQATQPAVDPATFAGDYAMTLATAGNVLITYPHVPEEPPLKPYAAKP